MKIRLVVVQTENMKVLVDFYCLLGLTFEHHQPPFHYSANIHETVFEIYPLAKGQENIDKYIRLGFEVNDL